MNTKENFIDRYFQHPCVEYPKIGSQLEILPLGQLWEFVPNTFLDGFFNSCGLVLRAYVLGRYTDSDQVLNVPTRLVVAETVPPSMTKQELIALMTASEHVLHVSFNVFLDDVVILKRSKIKNSETSYVYWFFWFDQDSSDCTIGRFVTEDSSDEVEQSFAEWIVQHPDSDKHPPVPLPTSFFSGWCSSQ